MTELNKTLKTVYTEVFGPITETLNWSYYNTNGHFKLTQRNIYNWTLKENGSTRYEILNSFAETPTPLIDGRFLTFTLNNKDIASTMTFIIDGSSRSLVVSNVAVWTIPLAGHVNLIDNNPLGKSTIIFNPGDTPTASITTSYQKVIISQNFHQDITPSGTITSPNRAFIVQNNYIDINTISIIKDGAPFTFIPITDLDLLKAGRVLVRDNEPGSGQTELQFYISDAPRASVTISYIHHNIVTDEIPVGNINGINILFAIASNTIQLNTLTIVKDGIVFPYALTSNAPNQNEIRFISDNPSLGQSTIEFNPIDAPTASLIVNYHHSGISVSNEVPTGIITVPNKVFTIPYDDLDEGLSSIFKDDKPFEFTNIFSGIPTQGQVLIENDLPSAGNSRITFHVNDAPFQNLKVSGISFDTISTTITNESAIAIIDGQGLTFSLANDNIEANTLMIFKDTHPFAFTEVSGLPAQGQVRIENQQPSSTKTRITFNIADVPTKSLLVDYRYDRRYNMDKADGRIYNVTIPQTSTITIDYYYLLPCDILQWSNKTRRFLTYDIDNSTFHVWRDDNYDVVHSEQINIKDYRNKNIIDSIGNLFLLHNEGHSKYFIISRNGQMDQLSWNQEVYPPNNGTEITYEPDPWVQGFWTHERYPVFDGYIIEAACLSTTQKYVRILASTTSKKIGYSYELHTFNYDFTNNKFVALNTTFFAHAFEKIFMIHERFALIDGSGYTIPKENEIFTSITSIVTNVASENYVVIGNYAIFSRTGLGLVKYDTTTQDTISVVSSTFTTDRIDCLIDKDRGYTFISSGNGCIEIFNATLTSKLGQINVRSYTSVWDESRQSIVGMAYDPYYKNLSIVVRSTFEKSTILNLRIDTIGGIYLRESIVTCVALQACNDYMESRVIFSQNLPHQIHFDETPSSRRINTPIFNSSNLSWTTDLIQDKTDAFYFHINDSGQDKIHRVSFEGNLIEPYYQSFNYDNVKIMQDGHKIQWTDNVFLLQNNFENITKLEMNKTISGAKDFYITQQGAVTIYNQDIVFAGFPGFHLFGNNYIHDAFYKDGFLHLFDKKGNVVKVIDDNLSTIRNTHTTDNFTKISESISYIVGFNIGDTKFYYYNKGQESFRTETFHLIQLNNFYVADVVAFGSMCVTSDPNRKQLCSYTGQGLTYTEKNDRIVELHYEDESHFYGYDYFNKRLILYNEDYSEDSYLPLKYPATRIIKNGSNYFGIDDNNKIVFEINLGDSTSINTHVLKSAIPATNNGYYLWAIIKGPPQFHGTYRVFNEVGDNLIHIYNHSTGLFVKDMICDFIPEAYVASTNNPGVSEDDDVYDLLIFAISYNENKIQTFRFDVIGTIEDVFTFETFPNHWLFMRSAIINNSTYSPNTSQYTGISSYITASNNLFSKDLQILQNQTHVFTINSSRISCFTKNLDMLWSRNFAQYPYTGTYVNLTVDDDYMWIIYTNLIRRIDYTDLSSTNFAITGANITGAYKYKTTEIIYTSNNLIYNYATTTQISTNWSSKTKEIGVINVSGILSAFSINPYEFIVNGDDFAFISGQFIVRYDNTNNKFIYARFGNFTPTSLTYTGTEIEFICNDTYYKVNHTMSVILDFTNITGTYTDPFDSNTISNINGVNLADTSKSWTVNEFTGKYVSIEFKKNRIGEYILNNTNNILALQNSSITWTLNCSYQIVINYGQPSQQVVDSGTATVVGSTLTDTIKTWTVNGQTGRTVLLDFGYGSTIDVIINSNTSTTLTLASIPVNSLHPSYYIIDSFEQMNTGNFVGITKNASTTFLMTKNYIKNLTNKRNYRPIGVIKKAIVDNVNSDIMYYYDLYSEKIFKTTISTWPRINRTKSYMITNTYAGNLEFTFDGMNLSYRIAANALETIRWSDFSSYQKTFNFFTNIHLKERINTIGTIFIADDAKNLYVYDETNANELKIFDFEKSFIYCKKVFNSTSIYNFETGMLHELDLATKQGSSKLFFAENYLNTGEILSLKHRIFNPSINIFQALSDDGIDLKLLEFNTSTETFARTTLINNLPAAIKDTHQINTDRFIRTETNKLYQFSGNTFSEFDSNLFNVISIYVNKIIDEYIILYQSNTGDLMYRVGDNSTYTTRTLTGNWPITLAQFAVIDNLNVVISNSAGDLFIGEKSTGTLKKILNLSNISAFEYAYIFGGKIYYVDIQTTLVNYRTIRFDQALENENNLFNIPITVGYNIKDAEFYAGQLILLCENQRMIFIDNNTVQTTVNMGEDFDYIKKYRMNVFFLRSDKIVRLNVVTKAFSHGLDYSSIEKIEFWNGDIWLLVNSGNIDILNTNNLAAIDSLSLSGTSKDVIVKDKFLFTIDDTKIYTYTWDRIGNDITITEICNENFIADKLYDGDGKESCLALKSNGMWRYGFKANRPFMAFADFAEPGYLEFHSGQGSPAIPDSWEIYWDFDEVKKRMYHKTDYFSEEKAISISVKDRFGNNVPKATVECYIGNGYYSVTLDRNDAQSSPGKHKTWQQNWLGNMKGWRYDPTTYHDGEITHYGHWEENQDTEWSKTFYLDRWPDHQMHFIAIAYRSRKVM
jgi:hypothetical protein